MRKAVFFTCCIISFLIAAEGYLVINSRIDDENRQNIREEAKMKQEYQEARGKVRGYLREIGIEAPSIAEVEENPYIYRYNHELGKEKGLLDEDRLNRYYLNLQAVYRANLDAYLMEMLDVEDLDEELVNSSLGFVSRRAEDQNLYERESTMGLAHIYQRNNLYIEYLSEEQLSILRQSLESEKALVTNEIKDMVRNTFREVVRVRNSRDWEDKSEFLYPEAEGKKPKIPNHALVLGITNAMKYDSSGKLLPDRYRREKYEYLDRIKKEKEKEYSEILGAEVYILIE